MKKLNSLPEEKFLKLVFGALSACFLIAALCMPDRKDLFSGMLRILTQPCKVATNYFAVGGYAATFFNMGLIGLICLLLFVVFKGVPNNVSNLGVILTIGFGSWGIHILNIWPTILGVMIYCLLKKESFSKNVNAMIYSTGIAPLITDLMLRYPNAEAVGFHPVGILLSILVGIFIGLLLPAGMAFSPKVHLGFDLYSAALPVGMLAFFLQAVLFKTMGVALPAAPAAEDLSVESPLIVNTFCIVVFGLAIVVALLMGCKWSDYGKLLKDPALVYNFSKEYGNSVFLMNLGVFGLFILAYYNLIGGSMNGVTFGIIFCMLSCCDSGSHPGNVWPIMAGYVLMSLVFGFFSGLAGGKFAGAIYAQPIMIGLCYANGLSPVADKYGWQYGILAGAMHYILVTSVPALHGGFCLYNGGFTAALICLILVPQLERFFKTRSEKRSLKA